MRAKIAPVQGSREQPLGVDALSSTKVPRGHHKVFLGMAAGVGKTYQMLREGQADAENGTRRRDRLPGATRPGRDGRPGRGTGDAFRAGASPTGTPCSRRWTCPAILRRRPELCLIDELAHTNAPGVEHEKRYEDVEDVLAAGIDVFSTVNVQHLESLNDQVAELTGTRVRETVPDAVIGAADEVVLIDITPQSLIERLIAGKVYPRERVQSALNNFFKVENLSALREVALRQVAEEVEAKRIPLELVGRPGDERLIDTDAPQAVGERLLALITPSPKSQRVVRRAWRSAQRLGAELDVLWVADHDPNEQEQEQLDALRKLVQRARRSPPDRAWRRRRARRAARGHTTGAPPTF